MQILVLKFYLFIIVGSIRSGSGRPDCRIRVFIRILHNDILEDFIKNHPNNLAPGKIDADFKGQTAKEILDNLNQNINFVPPDFYELFPYNIIIDSIKCKGIGAKFKFIVSTTSISTIIFLFIVLVGRRGTPWGPCSHPLPPGTPAVISCLLI